MAAPSNPFSTALAHYCRISPPELRNGFGGEDALKAFAEAVIKEHGQNLREKSLPLEIIKFYLYFRAEVRVASPSSGPTVEYQQAIQSIFKLFWDTYRLVPSSSNPRVELAELWKPAESHLAPGTLQHCEELILVDEFLRRAQCLPISDVSQTLLFDEVLRGPLIIPRLFSRICDLQHHELLDILVEVCGMDLLREIASRADGMSALYMAMLSTNPAIIERVLTLYPSANAAYDATLNDPEPLLKRAADSRQDGTIRALAPLIRELSPDRRANLLSFDPGEENPLSLASVKNCPDNILALSEMFTKEELAPFFEPVHGVHGPLTPLNQAVSNERTDALQALIKIYDPQKLDEVLTPKQDRMHPFTWALWYDNTASAKLVAEHFAARHDLRDYLKLRAFNGKNILHATLSMQASFRLLTSMFSREELSALLVQRDHSGATPLKYVASEGFHVSDQVTSIMEYFGPEALARGIAADRSSSPFPIFSSVDDAFWDQFACPILQHIQGHYDLARSLGHCMWGFTSHTATRASLMERYPRPVDRLRLFFTNAVIYERPITDLRSSMQSFVEGDNGENSPLYYLSNKSIPVTEDCAYSKLQRQLNEYPDSLAERVRVEKDPQQRKILEQQHRQQEDWRRYLSACLAVGDADEERVLCLAPVFQRIQKQLNAAMRHELLKLILKHNLAEPTSLERLQSWLEKSPRKGPCVYFLLLSALEQRGVSKETVSKLEELIRRGGMSLHESHTDGKVVLNTLLQLLNPPDLSADDLDHIIQGLSETPKPAGFMDAMNAIEQVLGFNKVERLKACTKSFVEIARDCFHEVLPLPDLDSFLPKYYDRILTQRESGSLITYAKHAVQDPRTLKELGLWLHSVLEGTFLENRYSDANNPHLEKLYQIDPSLEGRLRSLCKTMGKKSVGDLASGDSELRFPLERSDVETKILTDKHLPDAEERFPLLMQYLHGKTSYRELFAEIRTTVRPLETRLSRQGKRKERDEALEKQLTTQIAELRFQQFLAKLCEGQTRKQKTVALEKVREHAKKLENLGQFQADIEGAIRVLGRSATNPTGQLQVFLSDDYWDLFRIGSDVQGSCQNVNSSFGANRCLLGYVLDGKTIPIVVKEPNNARIMARRLLRVEIDTQSGRPALFLERLYSNSQQKAVDEAIIAMAKQVADHLQMPLYSISVPGTPSETTLKSEGSAATWVYTDAGSGGQNGHYSIVKPRLVYEPVERPIAASSSYIPPSRRS